MNARLQRAREALRTSKLSHLLAALLAALVTGAATVAIDDDGNIIVKVPLPRAVPVTVPAAPPATAVDGADKDRKRDDALPLDAEAQDLLEDVSTPAGKLGNEIDEPLREPDDGPVIEIQGPLATPTFPGCRTAFVRNMSSRYGTRPQVIVWHQTVSRENGQSSQNALTALANNPAAGVSWHFLIGRKYGKCTYTVPLDAKAWTQGNANPFSIGIEVEAYGDESTYVEGAGREKLLAVTRRLGKIYGIPMRRGIVRDCRVIRSGIVEHKDLDQSTTCAGGHADVNLPGTSALIAALAKPVCGERCKRARELRRKHKRTHEMFERRDCHLRKKPRHGYCRKLRNRNKAVHLAAKRERISLKGSYP